jgi:hypothetical protein
VSDSSTLRSRWLLLLKIEISSVVHCCFIINQNELKVLLSHFEWSVGLSDTKLKEDHSRNIPAKFALIWFSGFRGEDLNVIFYQNRPNLHNLYKSAERKISQENPVLQLSNAALV